MDFELTTMQAAELLGVSDRRIRQLAEEGIIIRLNNDKFDARKIAEQYYRFKFDAESSKDFEKEKSKHESIKRKLSEIKLAKLNKSLISVDKIEVSITNMIVIFRNRVLAVPAKIAPKLVGIKNLNQISIILETELNQCLNELSNINPETFVEEDYLEEVDSHEKNDN
jgi:phage terminase Nu1 subunit (DNA packaging protein)